MFIIPTLCGGGAEKTVANLSRELAKKHNVYIVVFKDTETKYSFGGTLIALSDRRRKKFFRKIVFILKLVFVLKKLKKELTIDCAVSFLTPADIFNVLSKRKKCKTLISIRNTDSVLLKNRLMRLATKASCILCDGIVAISKQVKDDLIVNFGINHDKIKVIYNPSIVAEFNKNDKNTNTNSIFRNKFVFINVGRLVDQKGQWHLMRSFYAVSQRCKNARLIILGEGKNNDLLRNMINYYKLDNKVALLGFVDNPYDYMMGAQCFVFSSLYEGLGNAVLEAMACGLPVISTDCVSGPREMLDPKSDYSVKIQDGVDYAEFGILCPVFSGKKVKNGSPLSYEEERFAQAMISVYNDKKLLEKYKNKSLKRSIDFDIKNIAKEWMEIIK